MTSPVFFDASGRRRRYVGRTMALLVAAIVIAAMVFATTLVDVPAGKPLEFGSEREQPLPFLTHLARLKRKLPLLNKKAGTGEGIRAGFYVPWDPDSSASLRRNYNRLDWVIAASGQIDARSGKLAVPDDPQLIALTRSSLHLPQFFLMVQNAAGETWDGPGMARLLAQPARRDALIQQTIAATHKLGWQGAVFDIENIPASSLPAYLQLLVHAHAAFAKAGISLGVTVPAGEPAWDLKRFAAATDQVYFMDYDQHWQGGEAGPIAAQDWFAAQLAIARRDVPSAKLIVALGSYGYDWHDGKADALTISEAWLSARDSGTTPTFDPASGNAGFAFDDDDNGDGVPDHRHTVWMMDAVTSWNQLALTKGLKGVALWRLGSEDPGFWDALAAARSGSRPDLSRIPESQGTDVEGNGEILRIASKATGGMRDVTFASSGLIAGEAYRQLPTPYLVERTGGADPKAIALTFDDGPDPDYTPRILDILEAKKVPGTFFVIGENAIGNADIIRRIARDGFELGNHSYTHPNLAEVSDFGTLLELNATQRLIESYTGHSTRLFRAPYFGDAEPTTADELRPAELAQARGYTIVGLHVDPGDWRTPGVAAIVERTVAEIENPNAERSADDADRSANIVLLHDGGGNREQTVAALPLIIDRLRADGYRFVNVSDLAGMQRSQVMPLISNSEKFQVDADVGIFLALATAGWLIRYLFFLAIALGIARAVAMTVLALLDRKAGKQLDTGFVPPPVSVIIPAYNEERVIIASIERVLSSTYPALDLIVADDGSKDATSALVMQHFGGDPRVRLLTLVNGGKAAALNRALKEAGGEIVIALDADTHFLPDTITKLVRWFADPKIGAVAGNARVGNRINLVTRWQAIEYVTAQNVERRALDSLRAITVVPGAVGAWRRAALDEVGGYPEDTLAEDQDLTIAIQRAGWRVAYDVEAIALTEAPETYAALGKQRFRWSFGTLQCLWKHRRVLREGRPRGLAWFGMPQAWLFQIVFAAISPVIDLALILSIFGTIVRVNQHGWDQTQSDVLRMGLYWTVFVGFDLVAGWIAYRLEPTRQRFPAGLMVLQRFVYRQLMYGVVLRSIAAALRGRAVGWGKLDRTGSVTSGAAA